MTAHLFRIEGPTLVRPVHVLWTDRTLAEAEAQAVLQAADMAAESGSPDPFTKRHLGTYHATEPEFNERAFRWWVQEKCEAE